MGAVADMFDRVNHVDYLGWVQGAIRVLVFTE